MTTPLCKLAYKYHTDKCKRIKHPYTPFYYELFKDKKEDVKKLLELGVGRNDGASLRMWKEFFPNAEIYGMDIRKERLIQDEGIISYHCNGAKEKHIRQIIKKVGEGIDIFIDDGSHKVREQAATCKVLRPLLKKDVIYIIEDVVDEKALLEELKDFEIEIPKFENTKYHDDKIFIIK